MMFTLRDYPIPIFAMIEGGIVILRVSVHVLSSAEHGPAFGPDLLRTVSRVVSARGPDAVFQFRHVSDGIKPVAAIYQLNSSKIINSCFTTPRKNYIGSSVSRHFYRTWQEKLCNFLSRRFHFHTYYLSCLLWTTAPQRHATLHQPVQRDDWRATLLDRHVDSTRRRRRHRTPQSVRLPVGQWRRYAMGGGGVNAFVFSILSRWMKISLLEFLCCFCVFGLQAVCMR
jgi:hypothetical protein